MPIYEYKCVDCGGRDSRVAGIDDYTALCAACGGLMLRLDDDLCSRILPRIEEGNMARKKVEGLNGWEGADQALRLIGIWSAASRQPRPGCRRPSIRPRPRPRSR